MPFLERLKKLKRSLSPYDPLVEILVSKDNLLSNFRTYQNLAPKFKIAPVLKSNAYGHGLGLVGKVMDRPDIAFLVVDSLYEAMELRGAGVKAKILIIGYTRFSNIEKIKIAGTAFTITSFDQLKIISNNLKRPRLFHLKLDTGMHRQGIGIADLPEAVKLIKQNRKIILEGLCSHLADADGPEKAATLAQIKNWNVAAKTVRREFPGLPFYHLSNTAGLNFFREIDANTARLGIGLYGFNPDPKISLELKPALAMKTVITSLRDIEPGEAVGYGYTYKAAKKNKLATVPVGYFEGVDRRLSGKGFFLAESIPCPIAGRVSMNITSIDVSNAPNIKIEDPVEIIGGDPKKPNSLENQARLCGTIPYELLVHIPGHLRRTLI